MADPTPRRRRARVRRDEDRDDDAPPPPPAPRSSAPRRGLLIAALAAVAFAGLAKLLRDETDKHQAEAALADALMPLPVDAADCDRWVRRQTEAFTRLAMPDGAVDAFDRTIVDSNARDTHNQCVGYLVGRRIPKAAFHCLSNETDYVRMVSCAEEAKKGAR